VPTAWFGHGRRLATVVLLAGCATAPQTFRYRLATSVGADDWAECHTGARDKAEQTYRRYAEIIDSASPFGGPFGGPALSEQPWAEREAIYEREMRACLAAKGYVD
jgi:hypothetical protein